MSNIESDHGAQLNPALKGPRPTSGRVHRFHTMVKPSGSQCNLNCTYCFYLHKQQLLEQPPQPRMADSLLEDHIRQYIEAQTGGEVIFSWQGGEPTLMGLPFFARVVELQQKYKKPNQRIENDLQTNGILLNDEWCAFLRKHNFLVGLSIDGPARLHDVYRRSKGGQPTHARVMHSISLLRNHRVDFTALCVVNRVNAERPIDVYRFIRDEVRPRVIQFIPGVEPSEFRSMAPGHWNWERLPVISTPAAKPGNESSIVSDWSVDPDRWGYFLTRVWDEWFKHDYGRVYVNQFENVISMMFGRGPQTCTTSQNCGGALAIEYNGDLYSCDHYVYPEYRLGNIREDHQGNLAHSRRQRSFALAKHETLPRYCKSCSYLLLCWGECPRNRFVKSPDGEVGLNYLCAGLKKFYAKAVSAYPQIQRRMAKRS